MRKVVILLLVFSAVFVSVAAPLTNSSSSANAIEIQNTMKKVYKVFSTQGEFLIEKEDVNEGDEFLTRNFEKYKIISKDKENGLAVAEFLGVVEKPKIDFGFSSWSVFGSGV